MVAWWAGELRRQNRGQLTARSDIDIWNKGTAVLRCDVIQTFMGVQGCTFEISLGFMWSQSQFSPTQSHKCLVTGWEIRWREGKRRDSEFERQRNVNRRCNNDSPWLEPANQESSPDYSVYLERDECCLPDYLNYICKARGRCLRMRALACNALITGCRLYQGWGFLF